MQFNLPAKIADVAHVALEQINNYSEPMSWFKDLLQHGCIGGMIPSLIYYADTHEFFDRHYDEIEQLRKEYEDSTGLPLQIQADLKNFLAWFAFEEVAFQIATHDLEFDL